MKIRLPVVQETEPGSRKFAITSRVEVAAELVEAPDDAFFRVRLLADGGGLSAGDELTVPATQTVVE